MEEGNSEKRAVPRNDAELRKVVHGIVSDVFEQKEQERKEAAARATRRENKRTIFLSLALVVVVAWVTLATLVPTVTRVSVMPDELLGLWTTPDERYADRALEIQKSTLVFHTGDAGFTTHPIQQVSRVESDTLILYHVDYLSGKEVFTLSFYHEPTHSDKIRFQNQQEMEWSR